MDNNKNQCHCAKPQDNDQGICMDCGRWINYRDNSHV